MKPDELLLLQSELARCTRYLEFGSGHSTLLAIAQANVERIDSVENHRSYLDEHLLHHAGVQEAIRNGRLRIHFCDTGLTQVWGRPIDQSHRHLWPAYSQRVFDQVAECDLVLIDGRFRVACALMCALRLQPQTRILIHDFTQRTQYHVVHEVLQEFQRVRSLAAFTIRHDLNVSRVSSLYAIYRVIPD